MSIFSLFLICASSTVKDLAFWAMLCVQCEHLPPSDSVRLAKYYISIKNAIVYYLSYIRQQFICYKSIAFTDIAMMMYLRYIAQPNI